MKYDDVQFHFLSSEDHPWVCSGTVIVRDREMALEIPWDNDAPYTVVGKESRGFFLGKHEGQPGDVPVSAKWIRLDDSYIGTWLEQRVEYLFRFHL